MCWNKFVRYPLVLVLATGLAACGDDSAGPGNSGDELSETETEVMMEALVEAGGLFVASFGAAGGPAPVEQSFPIDETESCPGGGSIDLEGNATIDDEAGFLDWNLTQTHQSCVVTASSDNSTWTFDGSPNIAIDFELLFTETNFDMNGTQVGGIAWSRDNRSGTCSINLSYDFNADQNGENFTGQIQGSVCGHTIDENITIDG